MSDESKPRHPENRVPPVAQRFQPGVSGNPGGRPRSREFRARCRRLAEKMLDQLEARIESDGYVTTNEQGREVVNKVITPELVKAFAEVSNRGGYLSVADSARLILDALAQKDLTPEERAKVTKEMSEGEPEPLLEAPDSSVTSDE